MFYRYSLEVPLGTPKNAPASAEIKLEAGIIHRVIISFPPGCCRRVHFAIFQGANKQLPTNPDEWFRGGNVTLDLHEHIVNKHGYHWYLKGYSPTALYDHVIPVRIGILPEEDVSPIQLIKDLVSVFKRMLGLKE